MVEGEGKRRFGEGGVEGKERGDLEVELERRERGREKRRSGGGTERGEGG